MCFKSKSSSSSTTSSSSSSDVFDERVGADNGSVAFRAENAEVIVSSDEVALASISNARDTLEVGTDFITNAFTEVLNLSDQRSTAAENNAAATQAFARSIVEDSTESADDRLLKVGSAVIGAFVFVVFIQSGGLKQIKGIIK